MKEIFRNFAKPDPHNNVTEAQIKKLKDQFIAKITDKPHERDILIREKDQNLNIGRG